MKKENYICDSCKKENLECFIEIERGLIRRASGRTINKTMGVYEDELKGLVFCSIGCLKEYFKKYPYHNGKRQQRDMWEVGEQPKSN